MTLSLILMQLGVGMLAIWVINILMIMIEIIKSTPNWTDDDIDADEIVQNFLTNTSLERIEFVQKLAEMLPIFGYGGIVFLLAALIL